MQEELPTESTVVFLIRTTLENMPSQIITSWMDKPSKQENKRESQQAGQCASQQVIKCSANNVCTMNVSKQIAQRTSWQAGSGRAAFQAEPS